MNIYVGNLSHDATEDDLRQVFQGYGEVASVTIIKDKFSGQSKGFAFVEIPANAEAQAAIDGLNGTELKGRPLKLDKARPKDSGSRSGGGGRRGGGFGQRY